MTSDPGLAGWLQLTLTPGLGAATLRGLLQKFGLPENVLAASRAELARYASAEALQALGSAPVASAVERALAWLAQPGHSIVTLADAAYPRLLLEIPDPPALLYCRGRAELLSRPALAVVGSRNATAQGVSNAEQFARAFSAAGLTIVSGLAQGIDAAAHRGGLAADASTIAVLGTGVDNVYPRANAALAEEIAARGLLVSEFALGTLALAHNFPRRNRLISGLAQGCLVIEAALGSGSLITARSAAEQGREVFAIPGSIHSPLSKGCHYLIKQGAKLVESAQDVLEEFNIAATTRREVPLAANASADGVAVLRALGHDPCTIDALIERTNFSVDRLLAALTQLEIDGHVTAAAGGRYQRVV
jgi:DNA processing protein